MTVLSKPENIAVVRHGLAGLAEGLGAEPDLVDDIKTAVSEAVTNAVVHGYPESVGPIDVEARVTDSLLEIVVRGSRRRDTSAAAERRGPEPSCRPRPDRRLER